MYLHNYESDDGRFSKPDKVIYFKSYKKDKNK